MDNRSLSVLTHKGTLMQVPGR